MADTVTISELTAATPEVVAAISRLLRQLSAAAPEPTAYDVEYVLELPGNRLLVARDAGGDVVGMLTLVVIRIPTGTRALIEDVVVDTAVRGRGVGEALIRAAIDAAARAGAGTVELTSRPSRESANRLYQRVGFVRRETNVYRYQSAEGSQP